MTVKDILINQLKYLDMKEKYMRYHRRLGAKNALIAFSKSLEYIPPDEYIGTREEITEQEEKYFRKYEDIVIGYQEPVCSVQREEQIFGAIDALRAAGVQDNEIVSYLANLWGIPEGYARGYLELEIDFADRIGSFG